MTPADKAALLALADRVEALTGPCRETDALVALAKGWQETPNGGWFTPPGLTVLHHKTELPRYTASLDAAMTLVPAKSLWSVCDMEEGPIAQVIRPMPSGGYIGGLVTATAATPALALTAAALRAKAAS